MVCALCTTPQKNTHTKCTLPSPPHYRQSRPYLSRAVINRNSAVTLQDYGQFPHRYVDIFSNNHPFSIFSQINLKRGASRSPPPNHPTLLPALLTASTTNFKSPRTAPPIKIVIFCSTLSEFENLIISQPVKTKRQANFKDFKGFGAFKGLGEQNSFVCKLGFFWYKCQKSPIYTRTR
jgi:hypothetical protein